MEIKLVDFPLFLLHIMGYLRPNSAKRINIRNIVLLPLIFSTIIGLVQYYYIEEDIFEIIDNLELIAAMWQLVLKGFYIIVNKNQFLNLIELNKNFWNSNGCSKSAQKRVNKIAKTVTFCQKIFAFATFFFTLLIAITPFVTTKPLALGTWKMVDYKNLYIAALIGNTMTWPIAGLFVGGFEGLFIGFCYDVMIQFKILCDHLENMNVEDIKSQEDLHNHFNKLKICIEHHNFLIRYVKMLQKCYSTVFMIHYISVAPLICSELYATMESTNFAIKIRYGTSGINVLGQFCFYCIPCEFLMQEVLQVSQAIYNSNWYSKHFKLLRQSQQLMMQQSQQEVRFTASGILDINTQTLLTVMKFAFSLTTLLRGLK